MCPKVYTPPSSPQIFFFFVYCLTKQHTAGASTSFSVQKQNNGNQRQSKSKRAKKEKKKRERREKIDISISIYLALFHCVCFRCVHRGTSAGSASRNRSSSSAYTRLCIGNRQLRVYMAAQALSYRTESARFKRDMFACARE